MICFVSSRPLTKCSQDFPRIATSIPFVLRSCLQGKVILPVVSYKKHLIKDSGAQWLMFYSFGLDLLDRIWMVSKVVSLVVAFFITCVGSTFCARSCLSSWHLSTPKPKLPTSRNMSTFRRVVRVISLDSSRPSTKCSQDLPRMITFTPFAIRSSCLQAKAFLPSAANKKYLLKVSVAPWLMFFSLGLDLLDRIWMVSKVVSLVVAFFIGCVGSTFFAAPLYIPLYMYHLPKWHMMCNHF